MSIAGRIRDLLRDGLGSLVDSDTTLDDLEDEGGPPRSAAMRSRPPGPARTGRRTAPPRPPVRPPPDPQRVAELYQLLETPVGADLHAVKQSYRRLLRLHHPDIVGPEAGSTERVQVLIEAYAELCQILERQ